MNPTRPGEPLRPQDPTGYGAVFDGGRSSERVRLHAFADTFDRFTRARIEALSLHGDASILEIGPGCGSTAAWMQETLRPRTLTLLDRDDAVLGRLYGPGRRLVHADLTDAPEPPGTFDLVHARMVLMHLPDPQRTVEMLVSWLRPGGWLVLSDTIETVGLTDNATVIAAWTLARRAAEYVIGSDFRWARSFPGPLRYAGLSDVGLAVDVPIMQPAAPATAALALTLRGLAPVAEQGLGTTAEFEQAADAVLAMRAPCASPMGLATAWGRRS